MALQHIRSGTANKRPVASSLAEGQIAINYQADSPGAFFKDSAGNLVKVGPIHVGTTAPNATPAGSSGNSLGEGWLDISGVDAILKVWDGTAWVAARALVSGDIEITSINSGPLAGFRNAIINGNFDIWQRGDTFNAIASGALAADRWKISYDGGGTRNITRQPFTLGQTAVPGEPEYFLSWNQTVAPTSATFNVLTQSVEGVRTFAGQEVTVSFYAKASSSITLTEIRLQQSFGTGGTFSATVDTDIATNIAVGTSWQKHTFTGTLPSISGKTIGTDNNDRLNCSFRLPLTGTFTFDIAKVQLEPGPIATPFEHRPIGTELALCQRYYQQSRGNVSRFSGNVTSAADYYATAVFMTAMRAVPIVTLSNSANTNFPATAKTVTPLEQGYAEIRTANGSGPAVFQSAWTADAEL